MSSVTIDRWREAQAAEREYWDALRTDEAEFMRVLSEKVEVARWAAERLGGELPGGDWAEIGIGPFGLGCLHFLRGARPGSIVGVEPLPLLSEADIDLPDPLAAAVAACRSADYVHVEAPGENTGLASGGFGLVCCYNVLDHVRDPLAVLRECRRILAPGGKLVLGCDTVSSLSVVRFRLYVRRRHPDAVGVRAHPFRFRFRQLAALVWSAGFRVLAAGCAPTLLPDLAGHARRPLLLCERTSA